MVPGDSPGRWQSIFPLPAPSRGHPGAQQGAALWAGSPSPPFHSLPFSLVAPAPFPLPPQPFSYQNPMSPCRRVHRGMCRAPRNRAGEPSSAGRAVGAITPVRSGKKPFALSFSLQIHLILPLLLHLLCPGGLYPAPDVPPHPPSLPGHIPASPRHILGLEEQFWAGI